MALTDEEVMDFIDRFMPAYLAYLPSLYENGPERRLVLGNSRVTGDTPELSTTSLDIVDNSLRCGSQFRFESSSLKDLIERVVEDRVPLLDLERLSPPPVLQIRISEERKPCRARIYN